jgi:type II secretory pathway component PulJ
MKFAASSTGGPTQSAERAQGGFTLAEVLAALLFMAIVIPVAVEGLRVASLAGEVGERKSRAARVAERMLTESLITSNWSKSVQSGTVLEGDYAFRWNLRSETWGQDGTQYAPHQLSVEVLYTVQNRDYSVRLSTLSPTTQLQ